MVVQNFSKGFENRIQLFNLSGLDKGSWRCERLTFESSTTFVKAT